MADRRRARLESLFDDYSRRVLAYALHRGMSFAEAEDVVSETFLVCWRRLDDVPSEALPWIFVTARKIMANHRRTRQRQDAVAARIVRDFIHVESHCDEPLESKADRLLVWRALAKLGEKDREAIILVAWDGLSNGEAARVMGCTRAAFAVRSSRARAILMKHIEDIRTYEELGGDISSLETS